MTVVHLGNQRYEGLTADTKPTNVPSGALFRDTQLDIIYEYNGSSWDIIFGNTKTETLTNKTIDADSNTISNIENADIKAAAGIVYSKLTLTDSIVNADINSAAAIDTSKLADSANFLLSTLDNDLGAHHFDMSAITAPANPSANEARFFIEAIDANNDGLYCHIKKNGSFVKLLVF